MVSNTPNFKQSQRIFFQISTQKTPSNSFMICMFKFKVLLWLVIFSSLKFVCLVFTFLFLSPRIWRKPLFSCHIGRIQCEGKLSHFNKSLPSEACFLCYLKIFKTSKETNYPKDAYNESSWYCRCKQTQQEQLGCAHPVAL